MNRGDCVLLTIAAICGLILFALAFYCAGQADFANDCEHYGKHKGFSEMYVCQVQK